MNKKSKMILKLIMVLVVIEFSIFICIKINKVDAEFQRFISEAPIYYLFGDKSSDKDSWKVDELIYMNLSLEDYSVKDLDGLDKFTSLQGISIEGYNGEDGYGNTRTYDVKEEKEKTIKPPHNLEQINKLNNLKNLNLAYLDLTDVNIEPVVKHCNNIIFNNVKMKSFDILNNSNEEYGYVTIADCTVDTLDGLDNKTEVNLYYNTYLDDINKLSDLNITFILLYSDNPEDFEALSKNPYISNFYLGGKGAPDTPEEIEAFKNCESVYQLVINGEDIDLGE